MSGDAGIGCNVTLRPMVENTLRGLHVPAGCKLPPEPCGKDGDSSTGPESSARTSVGATMQLSS